MGVAAPQDTDKPIGAETDATNAKKDINGHVTLIKSSEGGGNTANGYQALQSAGSGGEDRLTENVTIKGGGGGKVNVQDINPIKGKARANTEVATDLARPDLTNCVTESGAVDANCDGVPDADQSTKYERERPSRPEPRQQRR